MKKHLLASTAFLALMLAGNFALADNTDSITQIGDDNQGIVMQQGDHNTATIGQVGAFGIPFTSGQNRARISQKNEHNMGTITQFGNQHQAEINQKAAGADHNTGIIAQEGKRNQARIDQKSDYNVAEIRQGNPLTYGGDSDDKAFIIQNSAFGLDHAQIFQQFGSGDEASIHQTGYGGSNSAKISQNGGLLPVAGGNKARIAQHGVANNSISHPALITQLESLGSSASILQTGDLSIKAEIKQTGLKNTAVIKQLRDNRTGYNLASHSATIDQGSDSLQTPGDPLASAYNNAVIIQKGSGANHTANIQQGNTPDTGLGSFYNTAQVSQTQIYVDDNATILQSGIGHLAITIQGTMAGDLKTASPVAPTLPQFGVSMFTN